MKKIIFIISILSFSILSCSNVWNDLYDENAGGLVMVYIPSGTFSRDGGTVNISMVSPFYMSDREVTRAQFVAVTGITDPSDISYSTGTDNPVQMVNFYHAMVFCNRLSIMYGKTPVYTIGGSTNPSDWIAANGGVVPVGANNATWDAAVADFNVNGYRLPTEMEWMWVAMGGASGSGYTAPTYLTGFGKLFAGSNSILTNGSGGTNLIGDYAWYDVNSGDSGGSVNPKTHTAVTKLPNELGLYDMSGNVWEWCWDKWDGSSAYPGGLLTDYCSSVGISRVVHGGSFADTPTYMTVANRFQAQPRSQNYRFGFRVVHR